MKKQKFHYAWVIMIACALTQIGSLGAIVYPMGIFYLPVAENLGVGVGSVALSQTILALVQAFSLPYAGKILAKINVVMSIAGVGFAIGMALLSFYTQIWQWYITTAIMGFCAAFLCFIPTPILINNWFDKKSGLALGIATATGSLGGAVITTIGGKFIAQNGLQSGFYLLAVISAIFVIIPSLFLIRFRPEDKGLAAYGAEEAAVEAAATPDVAPRALPGISLEQAKGSTSLKLMLLGAALYSTTAVYPSHLVPIGTSLGFVEKAALISALSMIGSVLLKIIIGAIKDKSGPVKTTVIVGFICVAIFVLMNFAGISFGLMAVLGLLAGIGPATVGMIPAWMTAVGFGSKDYSRIISRLTMAYSLTMGIYSALVGYIFDWTGSYNVAFIITAVCAFLGITFFRSSVSAKNNLMLQAKNEPTAEA